MAPVNRPLPYAPSRSVYSAEERVVQTIRTIESIRATGLRATIILLELGASDYGATVLRDAVDSYKWIGNKRLVRRAVDSQHRGWGEALGLLAGAGPARNHDHFVFKLSGRYRLTDEFDFRQWDVSRFNFLQSGNGMSTRLYGFPVHLYYRWKLALALSLPNLRKGIAIENELPKHIPPRFVAPLNHVGLAGNVAIDGFLLQE